MATKIVIEVDGRELSAELADFPAARAVAAALPLSTRMSRWGEEYYGSVGWELMEVGEMAFWPPGKALCIFFGRTPASTDERPKAASAVLPIGRVTGGLEALKGMGSSVRMVFRKG
jgi:hypothetical protein